LELLQTTSAEAQMDEESVSTPAEGGNRFWSTLLRLQIGKKQFIHLVMHHAGGISRAADSS